MDLYIQHINRRQSLIVQNIVLEESDDDEIIEEYQAVSGGAVYMSADSDPNVIRISTWD